MAGPIVAGEKPWLQAVLTVVGVLLFCMFMTPDTTRILLHKLPWVGWLINWGRHLLGLPPR
jgi:hypothetical protein